MSNDERFHSPSQFEIRHSRRNRPEFDLLSSVKERSSQKLNCAIRSEPISIPCEIESTIEVLLSLLIREHPWNLRRKEVIQPQVPLRLPCYDFIPITSHTFGICLFAVGTMTSGTAGFHDVTGGVYKAWERIHGAVADAPLLAIPAS